MGTGAMPKAPPRIFWRPFAGLGLLLGALFFAASVTPSLIPRTFLLQGALGGVCFALGYGAGVFLLWLWEYLELPIPSARLRRRATWAAAAVAAAHRRVLSLAGGGVAELDPHAHGAAAGRYGASARSRAGRRSRRGGADSARAGLSAERCESFRDPWSASRPARLLHRRARANGGALRAPPRQRRSEVGLRMADTPSRRLDELIEPETAAPSDPGKTGSAASLIEWEDLGRAGRGFVSTGPSRADIAAFLGRGALEPIRVYVGLNAADTPEGPRRSRPARAHPRGRVRPLGARRRRSDRHRLDGPCRHGPARISARRRRGDRRGAVLLLTSFISILVEPGYGSDTGRALFRAVYDHWTALPRDARPRLYLYGLSLGAISSEQSVRLYEVLADPIQGAVWAGPPFPSPGWRSITDERAARLARLAAALRRRVVRALHQPGERPRYPRREMGPDADRLPAICERPDRLLRAHRVLPQAGIGWRRRAAPTSRPSCAGIRS